MRYLRLVAAMNLCQFRAGSSDRPTPTEPGALQGVSVRVGGQDAEADAGGDSGRWVMRWERLSPLAGVLAVAGILVGFAINSGSPDTNESDAKISS
jgi:hypothetical protein